MSKDVFRTGVREGAAGIILAHNHPGGDPTPSRKDIEFTKEIKKAGLIIGIEVLDHIIVGEENYVSFRESGLL